MLQAEFQIEKKRIARSFSLAAKKYDSNASLQRKIADILLATISRNEDVKRVLDLGSGTGYCTKALRILYPNAEIVNLDIAEAMLVFASARLKENEFKEKSVCADAEALPFIENSFDVIFSSLAIQWCQDYAILFSELNRVLTASGFIHMSTFGPKTLQELALAWQKIDSYVHVNNFQSTNALNNELKNNGFNSTKIKVELMPTYYKNLESLARELKSIGASNKNSGQEKGLFGRKKFLSLKHYFENDSDQELGVPVTYQVFYIKAQKS